MPLMKRGLFGEEVPDTVALMECSAVNSALLTEYVCPVLEAFWWKELWRMQFKRIFKVWSL